MLIQRFGEVVLKYLIDRAFSLQDLSIHRQNQILDQLGNVDHDDLERSYLQYRCQVASLSVFRKIFLNVISLPYPFLALYWLFKGFLFCLQKKQSELQLGVAVYLGFYDYVIPESLREKYQIIRCKNRSMLLFRDLLFLWKEGICFRFLSPYFCAKVLFKVAMYRGILSIESPELIIATSEYSFTSSILTRYCELEGRRHFNVMHGEKAFHIRDSYFRFHRCFIWDEHYRSLFLRLKAYPDQFIVELPRAFLKQYGNSHSSLGRLTYYLASEKGAQLEVIRNTLKVLQSRYNVFVRPHPRYSDFRTVRDLFNMFGFEDPYQVGIDVSLESSEVVAGLCSTVLYQAYLGGKQVVIDDVSDPAAFQKLTEIDYIMLNKSHVLMSELVS